MKPAIEWGHAVEEAVAEDIQRDALDAAAEACEKYAIGYTLVGGERARGSVAAARTLASLLRGMKP